MYKNDMKPGYKSERHEKGYFGGLTKQFNFN